MYMRYENVPCVPAMFCKATSLGSIWAGRAGSRPQHSVATAFPNLFGVLRLVQLSGLPEAYAG